MSALAAAAAAPRVAAPRRASETRAVRASRTRVAAMSPSMPVAPELPLPDFLREPFKQVAERLEEALPADAKKQEKAQRALEKAEVIRCSLLDRVLGRNG